MRKTSRYRRPHQFRKRQSFFFRRSFWFWVFTLFVFSGFFYFLWFSDVFQVDKVVVTNEKRVSKEELRSFVEERIEKKILLFSTKSIFLVNGKKIAEETLASFPPIVKIEVKKSLPRTLNVIIVERLERALWCQAQDCFFLDGEGIIFQEIGETKPGLVSIQRQEESDFNLGEGVIDKDLLVQILGVVDKLTQDLKVKVEGVIVFPEYFKVRTPEGWLIHFNPAGDLDWQLVKLEAVLEEKIPPERRKDLEYIDLRFGNFAPFKYKQ